MARLRRDWCRSAAAENRRPWRRWLRRLIARETVIVDPADRRLAVVCAERRRPTVTRSAARATGES